MLDLGDEMHLGDEMPLWLEAGADCIVIRGRDAQLRKEDGKTPYR